MEKLPAEISGMSSVNAFAELLSLKMIVPVVVLALPTVMLAPWNSPVEVLVMAPQATVVTPDKAPDAIDIEPSVKVPSMVIPLAVIVKLPTSQPLVNGMDPSAFTYPPVAGFNTNFLLVFRIM